MDATQRNSGEFQFQEDFKDLDAKQNDLLETRETAENEMNCLDRYPETTEEDALAEQLLAEEMQKLSLVEHEKIMFDIHGISSPLEENVDLINQRLEEMEQHITLIRRKQAYVLAAYMNESYVTDRAFRIMFLRAHRFDAKLSAQRLLRHFEVKRALFGEGEVLGRDVLLSDLSDEDMRVLESGFVQILPGRDAAGRSIFWIAATHIPIDSDLQNCTRAMWYWFNNSLRDEETQKKGAIVVKYNIGRNATREPYSFFRQIHYVRSGLPMRIAGLHYCYDRLALRPFVTGFRMSMDKEARARFRPHFGTPENIAFELQTYGIPTKDQPILQNGELCLIYHRERLRARQQVEEQGFKECKSDILVPRRFDVLFGRGRNTREHTGNLRASHLAAMYQEEYEKATKQRKTDIAKRIVRMIHDSGGRFLKWESAGWIEVEFDVAREKISHFFRQMRKKARFASTDNGSEETKQVGKRESLCSISPSRISLSEERRQTKQSRS